MSSKSGNIGTDSVPSSNVQRQIVLEAQLIDAQTKIDSLLATNQDVKAQNKVLNAQIDQYRKAIKEQKSRIKRVSFVNDNLRREIAKYEGICKCVHSDTNSDMKDMMEKLKVTETKLISFKQRVLDTTNELMSIIESEYSEHLVAVKSHVHDPKLRLYRKVVDCEYNPGGGGLEPHVKSKIPHIWDNRYQPKHSHPSYEGNDLFHKNPGSVYTGTDNENLNDEVRLCDADVVISLVLCIHKPDKIIHLRSDGVHHDWIWHLETNAFIKIWCHVCKIRDNSGERDRGALGFMCSCGVSISMGLYNGSKAQVTLCRSFFADVLDHSRPSRPVMIVTKPSDCGHNSRSLSVQDCLYDLSTTTVRHWYDGSVWSALSTFSTTISTTTDTIDTTALTMLTTTPTLLPICYHD